MQTTKLGIDISPDDADFIEFVSTNMGMPIVEVIRMAMVLGLNVMRVKIQEVANGQGAGDVN